MARIRIVGPRESLAPATALLQRIGVLHIESGEPGVAPGPAGGPALRRHVPDESARSERERLEGLLEQIRKIELLLPEPISGRRPAPPPRAVLGADPGSHRQTAAALASLAGRAEAVIGKVKIHEDELSLLSRYDRVLAALAPLMEEVRTSRDLECLGLAIEASEREVLPLLEEAMARLTGGHYEVFYRSADRDTLAGLLVFPREKAAEVKALLWEKRIGELRLPASVTDKPLDEALDIILRKKAILPERIGRLRAELRALSARWRDPLARLRRELKDRLARIAAAEAVYETRMTFVLDGWAPRRDGPRLREALAEAFGGVVVVEELPIAPGEEERVPVVLSNRPLVRPFERLTLVLPLPRYGSIDPTPLLALSFPLFYGAIIGDIGYGLVLLALALGVRRRYGDRPLVRDLTAVFAWAALSALLWGVAYGELFGDLGARLGLRPLLLHRMRDFLATIRFALVLGSAHILLGIGLGIYSAWRLREWRELRARAVGLVLVAAAVAGGAGALGAAPGKWTAAGAAAALLCVPLLVLAGGPKAAMELHNLVNILSYLRIMGIGVASAALAHAANALVLLGGPLLLAIPAAAALHAVNLAFGVLSPAIQSLRLHYVEFFENFYSGGGRAYRPFRGVT